MAWNWVELRAAMMAATTVEYSVGQRAEMKDGRSVEQKAEQSVETMTCPKAELRVDR
jgi:hypothetical protein